MPECVISDIPVCFPFEPYDVQKAYMEKVISCLKNASNGVLESPTGTGKTLSLLCSTLAWVQAWKCKVKAQLGQDPSMPKTGEVSAQMRNTWAVPKIIYASRTHSQLTQAMLELKRTAYAGMRAVVLGSRDQLCIHPEVSREQGNSNKVQMCKLRVQARACSFYSRVESKKEHPDLRGPTVMDVEDLVKVGQKLKMCPYYAAKELVADADITFMPYNYLLDPKARKANKVDLHNTIIILDEAHNIEKICEESASVQIRSSDIAMAIEDVSHIMRHVSNDANVDAGDEPKDFTIEDLAALKEMLLSLEKAVDAIVVENIVEGATFPATYMFELLAKAELHYGNVNRYVALLDKLVQFLAVESQNPLFRKGVSLQILSDLLTIVFINKEEYMNKVFKSFKVHVQIEEAKISNSKGQKDGWLSKLGSSSTTNAKTTAKVINYWCFNPGFGMEQLLNKNVRSIILTSGTLAPLKPLIAELAIPVAEHLENPHIVERSQVLVKIIGQGPDREQLISNYSNRNNPKYISSLGQTVLNVSRIVPDGLLVFFPSYPLLNQCVDSWQSSGVWTDICRHKPLYVEPRNKESFNSTMEEFYQSIRDGRGACFMAVCRGKVSEGMDFTDRNGRAVIITGLPFPPMKDPKIILKKRYLEDNRTKENELLSGQEWYGLEATRAVNQAIGRVIRHRHDYGAILLCDARFQQQTQLRQLSKWIREHLEKAPRSVPFGSVVKELRDFFKNAEQVMPKPSLRSVEPSIIGQDQEESSAIRGDDCCQSGDMKKKYSKITPSIKIGIERTNTIENWSPADYSAAAGQSQLERIPSAMDFMSRLASDVSIIDFNSCGSSGQKRERTSPTSQTPNHTIANVEADGTKKKRFKVIGTPIFSAEAEGKSTPSVSSLDTFQIVKKKQLEHGQMKQAPEERVEFLRVLRSSLSSENFSAFTAALISYKREDTFDALMKFLLKVLGSPELHYMLLGMRRFLKPDHKIKFDEQIASFMGS